MLIPREITLVGAYFPILLVLFVIAIVVAWLVDRFLVMQGYYAFIWHTALFRLSMLVFFICCLGIMVYC